VPALLALCAAPGTAAAQGSLFEDDLAEEFPGPEGDPGMPDADFVFEVPVDVKNIFDVVTAVRVRCVVEDEFNHVGGTFDREARARGARDVLLVNGAYQGTVLVGADYTEDALSRGLLDVDRYVCDFSLIGPEGVVSAPLTNPEWEGLYWRRPDYQEPLTWRVTGPIPGGEE